MLQNGILYSKLGHNAYKLSLRGRGLLTFVNFPTNGYFPESKLVPVSADD